MDVHVPFAVTAQLRLRSVDALTAQQDGTEELDDAKLLDRASALGRVLVTQDTDFLIEAAHRQETSHYFFGIIYMPQFHISVSQAVSDLELIAHASKSEEWVCRVEYLPLK